MDNKNTLSTGVTSSPIANGKTKLDSFFKSIDRKKNDKNLKEDQSFGLPKHVEVINYVTKKGKNSLSWISGLNFPPMQLRKLYLAYSKRKVSLEQKIANRKLKLEYTIPRDSKLLGKLLKNIKETERIVRQEEDFFHKIQSRKPDIELKMTEKTKVIKKKLGKSVILTNQPSKMPRSGIILKDAKLF